MDFESQISQLKQKYAAETKQRLSEVDSSIQKLLEEMEALKKSHGDTLTQISELDAELAKLRKNLSDARKREQDIIASNKALSSSLGVVLDQLKPFEKKLQTHQAKLDNACSLKKHLSQKVPRTDITKLLEAQTDETISLETEEIHKLTQESQHLTVQVSDIQSKLKSGTLDLEKQTDEICTIKYDIRLRKQKLTLAESNKQYYLSQLESVKGYLEIAKQGKEHLLSRREVLGNLF